MERYPHLKCGEFHVVWNNGDKHETRKLLSLEKEEARAKDDAARWVMAAG